MKKVKKMRKEKKVSIIMIASNRLEYSKLAIESILAYTKNVEYELILVSNGSSDGTKEYFNQIKGAKVLHFEKTMDKHAAFNRALYFIEGEYTCILNNDVIVTKRWLSNLLKVIESDKKIGVVCPTCNYASNDQRIDTDYRNSSDMNSFAKGYNQSNPFLWEERLCLVMYVSLFKTKTLLTFNGLDEQYILSGFDADLCYRYRRAGYKLIYAKDTFVHRFSSVKNEYNEIMAKNQAYFIEKFGIDSVEAAKVRHQVVDVYCYDKKEEVNILGIGITSGATLLQLKNKLNSQGIQINRMDYIPFLQCYQIDLLTICNDVIYSEEGIGNVQLLNTITYDIVYYDELILNEEQLSRLLTYLAELKPYIKTEVNIIFEYNVTMKNLLCQVVELLGYHLREEEIGDTYNIAIYSLNE